MQNAFDLKYSAEALLSRVIFLGSSKKLNIFVEDIGKEYEYEEIFERLLPKEIRPAMIFPTGGKIRLEEAYRLFGKSNEYENCFFIADGDFDLPKRRKQIRAPNFLYLRKYNIESYLIDKKAVIKFMRPKIKKELIETESIIEYENWKSIVVPFLKKVFALHYLAQVHKMNDFENVGRNPNFFINDEGLPNESNYLRYQNEVASHEHNVRWRIDKTISYLESINPSDHAWYICGKYLLYSLTKYLSSRARKVRNVKIGFDELKAYQIANFDIATVEYIKHKIYTYISNEEKELISSEITFQK